MFGIGLPEMIVILAVALIVVGPDKLPELARSLAKGMVELKRTVNQVKNSLTEEDDVINSVQSDLRKTGDDLKDHLLDIESRTWKDTEDRIKEGGMHSGEILEMEEASVPVEEERAGSMADPGHIAAVDDHPESLPDEADTEDDKTTQDDSGPAP